MIKRLRSLLCMVGVHRFTEEIIDTWTLRTAKELETMSTFRQCQRCGTERAGQTYRCIDGDWEADDLSTGVKKA